MRIVLALASLALGSAAMAQPAAQAAAQASATNAAEVIARNVKARGGLEAWRQVQTMAWLGHLERPGKDSPNVPFVMHLKRPNLTRFELKEQYNDFTRIFDGSHGWKVRPASDGRPEVKSFSPEEADFSRTEFVIDGPLIDYQAKGVTAELDGQDLLDGGKAYRLSLHLPSGGERKVWIDTKTNLEVRMDRPATNPLKPGAPISVWYSRYTTVNGLKVPGSIETGVSRGSGDKLIIDQVLINPALDDATFLPPATPMRRGGKIRIPPS
jgi:outer membrane lipoprotein-sorting protein